VRICIVGAGAIGGLMGARLARHNEVTVIDRGPHLDAIRHDGIRVLTADGDEEQVRPELATSSYLEAGQQDLVILAVKAPVLPEVVPRLQPLLAADTIILPLQNGLPWWYFQRHGGEFDGRRIHCVDPDGRIAAHIDPERIIGCVVLPAGEVVSPGVIRHVEGNRLPVGELDGSTTARLENLVALLAQAGFKSFVLDDVRSEIWLKLLGNMSFNPISALTGATLIELCRHHPTRELARQMMEEAENIAQRLGRTIRVSIDKRIAGAERVGAHKTSMLQDVEAGRALEVEAVIGSVVELGRLTGVTTPVTDAVYALAGLLNRTILEKLA
jgi:2-dehydropantoate 2-reductase